MTEEEWRTSSDPEAMFEVVRDTTFASRDGRTPQADRKRLLFGAACCRLVWPWVAADDRTRRYVEYTEDHDGHDVTRDERLVQENDLVGGVKDAARHPEDNAPPHQQMAANVVYDMGDCLTNIRQLLRCFDGWGDAGERAARVSDLIRCLVGNPFRPVAFDPAWRSPTAVALADAIYTGRAFDRLPVLADALEDAGCDNPDVLSHCRGDGPHARGCWVVDLVLGKS